MDFGDDIGPGDINIYGGMVVAQGGKHGAGIGKGDGTSGPCNIMISGGYIKATGGTDAAGIGGGEGGPGGNIDISGGYIVNGTGPDDTHTQQCQYCTTAFQAEKHLVVDDKCALCGTVIEYPAGIEEVQGSGFKIQDLSDDEWYDLSGRKYSKRPAKPGVYIHTGKKEVIN